MTGEIGGGHDTATLLVPTWAAQVDDFKYPDNLNKDISFCLWFIIFNVDKFVYLYLVHIRVLDYSATAAGTNTEGSGSGNKELKMIMSI